MQETLKHKEAFEYYYCLGDSRGYREVTQKFNVTLTSIANWGKAFNWQERIIQRDIEVSKKLEKKTNTTVINEKANYRKIIKDSLANIKMKPESIRDMEILIKLDLLLMGEATEETTVNNKVDLTGFTTEQLKEMLKE